MANPVTLRVGVTASHVLPPSATPGSAGAAKRVELTARAALTKPPSHALSAFRTEQQKSQRATMHRYRSHTCGALRASDIGQEVRLSGWCHRIRDHGGVLFIDLRDHYGLTQVVADPDSPAFKVAERLRLER